jgi:hypothetical protein
VVVQCDELLFGAVIDAMGHGPDAAAAARIAEDYIEAHADKPVTELIMGCHANLRSTRGAALSVLRVKLSNGHLEYAGVGNVEAAGLTRHPLRLFNSPGVVGGNVRKVLPLEHRVEPGDTLVLYSDGISSRFDLERYRRLEPPAIAAALLEEHGKAHDDASCLVMAF